jgi:hypothetical protein
MTREAIKMVLIVAALVALAIGLTLSSDWLWPAAVH